MNRSLPAIALRRPITVVMLVITVIGLGVIAYARIPVEFFPELEFPFIRCYIPYPGATPTQVENDVAIPAEGEFRTISQLKRIESTSDMHGCNIMLMLQGDADMNVATAEVRDRMERLKLVLPDDVDRLLLHRFSLTSMPIMAFAIGRDYGEEEFTHLARTILSSRLLRVEGVADVQVMGKPEKEVLIEFDQNRLKSQGISLYQAVDVLQTSNVNTALGELLDGNTKYLVRALDEFTRPEEIGQLIVGPGPVRLRDVAQVGYRAREVDMEFSMDGNQSAFVLIQKEAQANTMATCRALQEELDAIRQDPLFADAEVFMFMDQEELISSSIGGLVRAGKFGSVFALIVLFLFLWRVRATLVVALAIPSSLLVGFVVMFFTGYTLNIITIISMVIAVGLLVDNSIVVMENILRHRQLGATPEDSARTGAMEVGMAITAATSTTVVVFVPILYLETGLMSTYMRQFAVPVTASLGASLLIALTVIPLAASRMRPRRKIKALTVLRPLFAEGSSGEPGDGQAPLHGPLARLRRYHPLKRIVTIYGTCLDWALQWRMATLLILFVVIVITIAGPYRLVGRDAQPQMDTREVSISVELDQNFDKEKTAAAFDTLQKVLDEQREELGIRNLFTMYSSGGGDINLYLMTDEDLGPGETFPYETDEVRDILWQRLPKLVPGGELRFTIAEASESSTRGFVLRMLGDDIEQLSEYAGRFKGYLEEVPHVGEVRMDYDRDNQEVQIRINETLAQQYGVSPWVIAQTVDFALRGIRLTYIKRGNREVPVWAQFREEDRKTRANLDNVAILSQDGELVPLNRLVMLSRGRTPQAINRVDGKNVVTIAAQTMGQDLGTVMKQLEVLVSDFSLPAGYSIQMGDELLGLEETMSSFLTAFVLTIILIYIVMGALFESFLLPLSILTTVPLAGIGIAWAMFLTGTPMDTICMIGVILLVGIIVNNGIVIVDRINQVRRQGVPRHKAILQAGHDRFRPVMMTALTTILGCVPLAVGARWGGDVTFAGLGRALIGGLTVGTLLTLVLVPVFYTLIDDVRKWTHDYFAGLARMR